MVTVSFLNFALFLEGPPILFNIFRKQILAAKFVEVAKVVDSFVGVKSDSLEGFWNELFLAPVHIPIIILR